MTRFAFKRYTRKWPALQTNIDMRGRAIADVSISTSILPDSSSRRRHDSLLCALGAVLTENTEWRVSLSKI